MIIEEKIPHVINKDINALIDNGLNFLDKAREEMENSQPQFSIVSFWTAVEILLKVPLVQEHWTLVCSGKNISRKKYISGDFLSVTYDETCSRLGDILEKPLDKKVIKIFDKIRKHRNRVVHFYHPSFTDDDLNQILYEQADAWFALNRLMLNYFHEKPSNSILIARLRSHESIMLRNSQFYISAKFNYIQPKLEKLKNEECKITLCPHCDKNSSYERIIMNSNQSLLCENYCLVCSESRISEFFIIITCPNCKKKSKLEAYDNSDYKCGNCNYHADRYEILNESNEYPEDYVTSSLPANCSECESYETVCEYGDGYLCTNCFTYHDSLYTCDYCSTVSTSEYEMSGLWGCDFCDGNTKLLYD